MPRNFIKLNSIFKDEIKNGLDVTILKYSSNSPVYERIIEEYNKDLPLCFKMRNTKTNRKFIYGRLKRLCNKTSQEPSETLDNMSIMSNIFEEMIDLESTQKSDILNKEGLDDLLVLPSGENISEVLKYNSLQDVSYQKIQNTKLNADEICALDALMILSQEESKFEFIEKTIDGVTDKISLNTNIINNEILNSHLNQDEIFISESSLCDGKGLSEKESIGQIVTFLENQMNEGFKYCDDINKMDNQPNIIQFVDRNENNCINAEKIITMMEDVFNNFKTDFKGMIDIFMENLSQFNKLNNFSNLKSPNKYNLKPCKIENEVANIDRIDIKNKHSKTIEEQKLEEHKTFDNSSKNETSGANVTLGPFEITDSSLNVSAYEKYRKIPSAKERLNRNVIRIEGKSEKPDRRFHSNVLDCKFNVNPMLIFGAKDDPKLKLTKNKFIIDVLREEYSKLNNACILSYYSVKPLASGMLAYAYCSFPDCAKYRFNIDVEGNVSVYRCGEIFHAECQNRVPQMRGVKRKIVKKDIEKHSAYTYRKDQILKAADEIAESGNFQNIQGLPTLRKLISERNKEKAHDPDPFKDVFNMQQNEYKNYIQFLASPLTVYCWEKETFETFANNPQILKDAKYTVFFDATGQSVRQIECAEKRILIYKIVFRIKQYRMVIPIVTAILSRHTLSEICSILDKLKLFCDDNKFKYPFFERVCTDVSYPLFGAVLKNCNNENVAQYLQSCFKHLDNQNINKRPRVIIQWCKAHYIHIICKDLNNRLGKEHFLRHFLKNVLTAAFSLKTMEECKFWFRQLFIVLLYPMKNEKFSDSYNILRKRLLIIKENDFENYNFAEDDSIVKLESIASGSPFKKVFLNIHDEIKSDVQYENINGEKNEYRNEDICNFIINKYCPFVPMWTNIMGILVDPSGEHISNAPVEFNFFLQKHIILKGKSVRPGEFIKKERKDEISSLKELRYKYNMFTKNKTTDKAKIIKQQNNKPEHTNDSKSMTQDNKLEYTNDELQILKDHSFIDLVQSIEPEEQWGKKNAELQKGINTMHMSNAKNTQTFTTTYEDIQDIIKIDLDSTEDLDKSSRISKEHSYYGTPKTHEIVNKHYKLFLFRYNLLFNTVYNGLKQEKIGFYNYLEIDDWESLKKGYQLTNLTLDCALLCIIKENFKKVLSLPCQINDICYEKVNTLALYKPDYIIIPILKSAHFTLCILNLASREFIFIDSLFDRSGKIHFDKFISSTCMKKDWKFVEILERTKQNDTVSCGVFVILYAMNYLKGKSLLSIPNSDQFRSRIKSLLIQHSDNRSEFCCHCGNKKKIKTKCRVCIYFVCKGCNTNIYNNKFSTCKICTTKVFS